jgi:hypothetical protein
LTSIVIIHTVQYCIDELKPTQAPDRVRQIAVPPATRSLSTLSHVDYADTFLVEVGTPKEWSAEQWARAVLNDAPIRVRANLLLGWSAIGLKPAIGRSGQSILGWKIRVSTPEFVLLGRDSLIGMPGELLFKCERHALTFATFVQHNSWIARAVWAAIEPVHIRVVSKVLEQASRRFPNAGEHT